MDAEVGLWIGLVPPLYLKQERIGIWSFLQTRTYNLATTFQIELLEPLANLESKSQIKIYPNHPDYSWLSFLGFFFQQKLFDSDSLKIQTQSYL